MKLELRGITKRFGTLVANDGISITIEPGEIHALLGENGAGKSTLMNVLFGLYHADEGEILLDDEPVRFNGPGQAMSAGIGMVHQHFMLIPVFTVAENVMLGHEPSRFGVIDLDAARARVREISARFGFDIDPDAKVEDLPVGAQQRVEIVKALSREAKVLVLDEPTAVLTPQETDELMGTMRKLADAGTSIVFITHKLREVKAVADRITVIRLGKVVGTAKPTASTTELASLMVGRDVDLTVNKSAQKPGEPALIVTGLTLLDSLGRSLLDDISFEIRTGEILAIAGVQGNGQTELTEAIIGLREKAHGSVTLNGVELLGSSVRSVLDAGVGYVPEDRKKDGLVAEFSIAENLMLDRSFSGPFTKGLNVDFAHRDEFAADAIDEFDVRTPGAETAVGRLSGGNQQKVVLARELSRDLQLLVASQPTRGVDVGSIEFIHERIVKVRDSGVPVLIISTELDEVLALADRIAVMYRGRIVDIVPGKTPREKLGQLMAGVTVTAPTDATGPVTQQRTRPTATEVLRDIASGGPLRIFLAVILSLAIGSLLIIFTNENVQETLGYFGSRPTDFFSAAGRAAGDAYAALFRGAIYNYNATTFEGAIRPLTESLRFAGPLIAAGLGIALGFRVGLFNIGGAGQMLMAAIFAGWASFQLHLPFGIHLVVALLFGLVGAGLWAGIVGFLKARTGAHEVIVTIMLNYIAVSLVTYLMRTPVLHDMDSGNNPTTRPPDVTAQFPKILGPEFDLHLGFLLCIAAVFVYWWLMERSTLGYRLRMVGLSPDAARTAGINVNRVFVTAMVLSGLFVGLAGVNQALGREGSFGPSIDSGIGFDAITVALLGGSRAFGVMFAGLLFGAMKAAGPSMQIQDVAPEVLIVMQGLIVLFVAAPPLVRSIFRFLPEPRTEVPHVAPRRKPRPTESPTEKPKTTEKTSTGKEPKK